jgi:hypothetical protein
MTKTMKAPVGKSTPQTPQSDKITKNNVEIGVVIWSSEMRVGGNQNYDMALAKIDPGYYKDILLQYRGNKATPQSANRFVVTKVDDNLCDDKRVFLFGNSSGYKEGKLRTSKPAEVPKSPYGKFIGSPQSQDITVHDCIQVQSVRDHTVTREGDSGGLWVNENGDAVGIQVMIGEDSKIAFIHPMRLVMDYFHKNCDGSLRFLTPNDLPKQTNP